MQMQQTVYQKLEPLVKYHNSVVCIVLETVLVV